MKQCSPALLTLLNTATKLCMLDLITFTMASGTILRYNSGPYTINVDGYNYLPAAIEVGSFKQALGTNVDDLTTNWYYSASDMINGVRIPKMLRSGAFDYAIVQHSNLFLTSWSIVANSDYVLPLFIGILQMDVVGRSKAEIRIKAMTDLLNRQVPTMIFQPGCMNLLYDPNTCGVSRTAFTSTSSVAAGGDELTIFCGLTNADGYYTKGSIKWTSGQNQGIISSVQSYTVGKFSLMWPTPFMPQVGDTFSVVPGCDRRKVTCDNVFHGKFRGTPFIPVPSITMGGY